MVNSLSLYISHLQCSLYNRHLIRAVPQLGSFNKVNQVKVGVQSAGWASHVIMCVLLLGNACVLLNDFLAFLGWSRTVLYRHSFPKYDLFFFILHLLVQSGMAIGTGWHSQAYTVAAWLGDEGDSMSGDTLGKTKEKLVNNVACFDCWLDNSKSCMC